MSEKREKVFYDHEENGVTDLSRVRITPDGDGYLLHHDELDDSLYIIEDDGLRTYLLWG